LLSITGEMSILASERKRSIGMCVASGELVSGELWKKVTG
jgi:hypothetical protein